MQVIVQKGKAIEPNFTLNPFPKQVDYPLHGKIADTDGLPGLRKKNGVQGI